MNARFNRIWQHLITCWSNIVEQTVNYCEMLEFEAVQKYRNIRSNFATLDQMLKHRRADSYYCEMFDLHLQITPPGFLIRSSDEGRAAGGRARLHPERRTWRAQNLRPRSVTASFFLRNSAGHAFLDLSRFDGRGRTPDIFFSPEYFRFSFHTSLEFCTTNARIHGSTGSDCIKFW